MVSAHGFDLIWVKHHGRHQATPQIALLEGWGGAARRHRHLLLHDRANLVVLGATLCAMALAANSLSPPGGGMALAPWADPRPCGDADCLACCRISGRGTARRFRELHDLSKPSRRLGAAMPVFGPLSTCLACNAGPHLTDLGLTDGGSRQIVDPLMASAGDPEPTDHNNNPQGLNAAITHFTLPPALTGWARFAALARRHAPMLAGSPAFSPPPIYWWSSRGCWRSAGWIRRHRHHSGLHRRLLMAFYANRCRRPGGARCWCRALAGSEGIAGRRLRCLLVGDPLLPADPLWPARSGHPLGAASIKLGLTASIGLFVAVLAGFAMPGWRGQCETNALMLGDFLARRAGGAVRPVRR